MDKTVRITDNKHKQCIIEIQAFRGNKGEFIIKELVIMDMDTNVVLYFLMKPPYSFKKLKYKYAKTNKWLMENYHHITWEEGFTDYKELDNIMYRYCQQFAVAYTSGLEKSKWIQQYMSGCVVHYPLNIKDLDVGEGFCLSVIDQKHKTTNCVLIRSYALLNSLMLQNSNQVGINNFVDGGGGGGRDTEYINIDEAVSD